MFRSAWLSSSPFHSHARRGQRPNPAARPRKARLFLEQLESRVTPSFGLSTLGIFTGANGQSPKAGLIMDSSGNLYGTTDQGGANGDGTVFEIAKGSGAITTLASFDGSNGADPLAGLIMDSSGNLYGTTDQGGPTWNPNSGVYGDGTVFELAKGSRTITTLASFNGTNGEYPYAGVIMDSSGNLYGTTYEGGASGDGTVFELAKGSSTITTLASFNGTNGEDPYAGVISDSSGNLYGTTYEGGASGDGTVFELAKGSSTITTLASFNGTNGRYPEAGLISDSSGNLYGTTFEGGDRTSDALSGNGTVFELKQGSGTITTLASFNGADGQFPRAALIRDSSGNLYGTTFGANGAPGDTTLATVFEVAEGSSTITTLASVNGTNGEHPNAGLIMDSSGNLYGTAANGGVVYGTVFEVSPHTPALSWYPHQLDGGYGTALSSAQLDASATDSVTGAAVAGTFVYTPAAGTILHAGSQILSVTFTPTDTTDYSPINTEVPLWVGQATPVLTWNTPASITYGTPLSGTQLDATAADPTTGSPLSGTFVYTPGAGSIIARGTTTLTVTFTPTDTTDYTTTAAQVTLVVTPSYSIDDVAFNGSNGTAPTAGLIMDSSGNLYGTADEGGADDDGTVFELAKGSGTITTLASFNGTDGAGPESSLIMDSSGNLYGTAGGGGADGQGTVFELAKGSSTITTLASFNFTNGEGPTDSLIMDSSGNLYGTAGVGGAINDNDGTVFEVAKGSGTITTLASFNGTNGELPVGGLIMDSSGNLYGTTYEGGASGDGTIFELASGSSTITALVSFNGTNGQNPEGNLILDSSGNLYGTTEYGGAIYDNDGTVFELAKGSSTITTLTSFNGTNGAVPDAGLIMDSSGILYGTTLEGGASDDGTVFEVSAGGVLTTMVSFGGSNGSAPSSALIMDSSGNFFGTTEQGGADGDGAVFELPATAHPSLQIGGFPSSTSAGSPQTFTVTIQNANGTTDTGYTGTVHFTSSDPKAVLPANFTFTAADAGQSTFTTTLKTAGTQSITATDTANSLVTASARTTVTPAAASQLIVTTLPPTSVTAGAGFGLQVSAEDPFDNVVPSFTGSVTLALDNNPSGTTLGGTLTATATSGVASFSGLTLDLADAGYTLKATTSGLSAAVTEVFSVVPAAVSKLVMKTEPPSSVTAGSAFGLAVTAEDKYGNVNTLYNATVTVALSSNPGKSTLGGTVTVTPANGVATFSGLTLNKVDTGYTLSVTSGTLTAVTASAIAVTPAAATQLVVTTQPPASVTAGAAMTVKVSAEDRYGNVATSFTGSVTVALDNDPGSAALGGTLTVSAVEGVASFATLAVDLVGTGYTLKATTSGLTTAVSNAFNVVPAAASKLVVQTQPPASVIARSAFGLTVTIEDKFGNLIPTYSGSVTLALSSNPGNSTLGGTLTATVASGVAKFSGLTLNRVDTGYTLSVTSGTLAAITTSAIAVTPAAATQLVVTTQPTASVTAGAAMTVKVSAEDRYGNVATSFTGSVTVALDNDPGSAALGGTLTVSAVEGVASFATLAVDLVGTGYTLKATTSGLTTAVSNAFNVVPAAASKLVVQTQPPGSVAAGADFGFAVVAEDKYGNIVTSFTGSVTVALGANPGASTLGGSLTVPAVDGKASFSDLTLNESGTGYTLEVSATGLTGATTGAFDVT